MVAPSSWSAWPGQPGRGRGDPAAQPETL